MSKSLDRLSKLIAQADNAGTDDERKTFMKAATKMSAVIGVELSVARAHHAAKRRELPVKDFKVQVNSWSAKPLHRKAMMDLFLAIARVHDVKCLIGHDQYYAFCFGLPSDIELTEKLYGVLSLQMVREADTAIKRGDQKQGVYPVDGRIYRRYFYEGFINRVAGRLWRARQEEVERLDEQAAEAGVADSNTGLVLRNKAQEISDFFEEEVKHMKLSSRGYGGLDAENNKLGGDWSGTGLTHGRQAAERADIGLHDRDMAEATRPELG
jgi:hypothetical protein